MKQSLALRQGMGLTMTPALQQAIRLLQLSSLDLQTEIQQVLDSNLMLEQEPDGPELDLDGPEAPAANAEVDASGMLEEVRAEEVIAARQLPR